VIGQEDRQASVFLDAQGTRANDIYDSRGSTRRTRPTVSGGCDLPGNWNVAVPPALSAFWAPRASQREANAHPRNRRRHTDRGLRIRHGCVVPELDAGAATGGAVHSGGKLRPRWTRMERPGARAANGTADRTGATHTARCNRCARAICSRWALVWRICEPGVRTHV